MSPNKLKKIYRFSYGKIRQYHPVCFLFKGVCLSLHFCIKVIQSIYFYLALFICYIWGIKITPTDLRRKLEVFKNAFQALVGECTCKGVSFQPVVFNDKFYVIPFLQHSQPLFQGSVSEYNLPFFPGYFRFARSGIKLYFTVFRVIDQFLAGAISTFFEALSHL